jgi:sugar phosphate isomerase/epimerase
MVMMRSAGWRVKAIAAHLGVNYNVVCTVLNSPDAKALLSKLLSYAADHLLEIEARIKSHAGEMLDTIVDTVRTTKSEQLKVSSAFKLLEMAGHGAIEKRQVEQVVKVEGPQVSRILAALDEDAMDLTEDVEGKFEVMGGQLIEEETFRLKPGDAEGDEKEKVA